MSRLTSFFRITVLWAVSVAGILQLHGQRVVLNPQRYFPKTVQPGNYSGITWLGGHRYAVVSDKSPTAGFYLMTILTDSLTGEIKHARVDSFLTSHHPNRDEEGICFFPHSHTIFTSGEADNQVVEYDLHGHLTGRRLAVPDIFSSCYPNSSIESLTYNSKTRLFWMTSEQTLRPDGPQPTLENQKGNLLRLQCFNDTLQPVSQYWYQSDSLCCVNKVGRSLLGVSGLAALDDGHIVVLEREARITPSKIGSFVHVKLYAVRPSAQPESLAHPGGQPHPLHKRLLTEFTTRFNLTARSFANYEGICQGPRLADGSLLLLMVADSQDQYGGYLRDYFRTVVIRHER